MSKKEYFKEIYEHKHTLLFLGGIGTAVIGEKILKSKTFKDACTKGMAGVLSIKKDAEECFQDMKDNAEDIVVDSHAKEKEEIYVEEVEIDPEE